MTIVEKRIIKARLPIFHNTDFFIVKHYPARMTDKDVGIATKATKVTNEVLSIS